MRTWLANSEGLPTPALGERPKLLAVDQKERFSRKCPGPKGQPPQSWPCSLSQSLVTRCGCRRHPPRAQLHSLSEEVNSVFSISSPHCAADALMKVPSFILLEQHQINVHSHRIRELERVVCRSALNQLSEKVNECMHIAKVIVSFTDIKNVSL